MIGYILIMDTARYASLLLMTCWMLASCNSTEKTPEKAVEPVAVPAAKPDNRPIIACFGDSLTEVELDSRQSYTDFLQNTLDQKRLRLSRGEPGHQRRHDHRRIRPNRNRQSI